MQDSASRETAIYKALNFANSYSIEKFNNAGDSRFSPCPKGAKLEYQCCVATLYKGL